MRTESQECGRFPCQEWSRRCGVCEARPCFVSPWWLVVQGLLMLMMLMLMMLLLLLVLSFLLVYDNDNDDHQRINSTIIINHMVLIEFRHAPPQWYSKRSHPHLSSLPRGWNWWSWPFFGSSARPSQLYWSVWQRSSRRRSGVAILSLLEKARICS